MALPVPVSEAARLSETTVAFARVCLCGVETVIAFAGLTWVFFVCFFGCRGVVGFKGCCRGARSGDGGFTVACISGCSGVIGFNVAMSPRPVREIVHPARLDVGASAKKFAQRAENTPILVFLGLLGEFFRG